MPPPGGALNQRSQFRYGCHAPTLPDRPPPRDLPLSVSRATLPEVRLLLFDIDGTLLVSGGAGRAAIAEAFVAEFSLAGLDDFQVDGRTDTGIFEEALMHAGIDPTPDALARMTAAYVARLPDNIESHNGRILDGVIDLLDALEGSGAVVGLATGNVARGAEIKLRHYGLWDRFAGGGFGDVSSDRTEVLAAALEALAEEGGVDVAAATAIVIGDTPRDVSAGHAIGARVLAVATGNYDEAALRESGADFVLPDLRDTQAALDILLG